jgi:hypothetical protein
VTADARQIAAIPLAATITEVMITGAIHTEVRAIAVIVIFGIAASIRGAASMGAGGTTANFTVTGNFSTAGSRITAVSTAAANSMMVEGTPVIASTTVPGGVAIGCHRYSSARVLW